MTQYSIVKYNPDHADRIIDLMQQFHKNSLCAYGAEFDRSSAMRTLDAMAHNEACRIYVLLADSYVIGVLSGFISPCVWNYAYKEFIETAWYMDEAYRGKGIMLYKKVVAECKSAGIDYIKMAFMENSVPDKIKEFFDRQGYLKTETYLVKKL